MQSHHSSNQSSGSSPHHEPVLVAEVLHYLAPETGGWFVDCTVGLGGHAAALLQGASEARLLGIDRDPQALALAAERLRPFGDRVRLVPGGFEDLDELLDDAGLEKVTGILADLGVSSLQLETAERGFSFRRAGPLDMRMGPGGVTAGEIVNGYAEADLEKILREYGEERDARRIVRAIVAARQERPIETTIELRDLIARAKGGSYEREGRVDPSTRAFQALRIEANQELVALTRLMEDAVGRLELGGRLVVISYHSLEDRIVKHSLRAYDRGETDQTTGRRRAETRLIEVLTKKPIRPSDPEVGLNPRARSARLRAARRL
ncbi:MAG: 16S rRNA (cytosine(1402)-N(4))-methyltransferase RsmH [Acidobacteriota bacterium]